MVIVDSSIWILYLRGQLALQNPDELFQFAVCGPIRQEVLQGLRPCRDSERFANAFRCLPCIADPLPVSLFDKAAEIYQEGRRRGATIRASNDCLIAAVALEYKMPVWHHDRDYRTIAQFTPLRHFTESIVRGAGG